MSSKTDKKYKKVSAVELLFEREEKGDDVSLVDNTTYLKTFEETIDLRKRIAKEDKAFIDAAIHEGNKALTSEVSKGKKNIKVSIKTGVFASDNVSIVYKSGKDDDNVDVYVKQTSHVSPDSKRVKGYIAEVRKILASTVTKKEKLKK